MSRYYSRRASIVPQPMISENTTFQPWPLLPSVCAADFESTDTGLVDVRGDPIMRAPNPVGFGKDAEW